jgi:uncharacterized protein YjbI with pentapeptide repeats
MKTLLTAAAVLFLVAAEATAQSRCPKPDPSRPNFREKDLTNQNFTGEDLHGANFTKAVLDGVQFGNADLTGAIFEDASIVPSARRAPDFTTATLVQACFQGATIRAPNLQFAELACTDFSHTDVTGVDFGIGPLFDPAPFGCGRAKFAGATIGVRQISFALWRYLDFTGTRFLDIAPDTFKAANLTSAMLPEAKLAGFDFRGATLTEVDLRRSDLRGAVFTGAKALRIKLDGADLSYAVAEGKETDFTAASMLGVTAQDADLSGAVLESAVLRGANLAGADLHGANLQGTTLQPHEGFGPAELSGANLEDAAFDNAQLNFVSFRQTRLARATFTHVTLADTDFSDAVMPGANFFGATLEGVTFRGSSLENASFAQARLRRSTISGRPADFACTQLGGANLAGLNEAPLPGSVTFLRAVLPDGAECRKTGSTPYCGTEPGGRRAYGPTLVPLLAAPAVCPNGELAICKGPTWLLRDWKTNDCGPPAKRWTPPPPEPPPPGQSVKVPDANFRACLTRQFFGEDRPIPADFAAMVLEIDCESLGIADATGLEAFTALQVLRLTGNALTDGEIFRHLQKLETLQVAGNKLTTLNLRIPTVKVVQAANNAITRVDGLETADLQFLDLSHNQLTEFALDSQRTLFYADLSHNALTRVGTLNRGFGALNYLHLQNNALTTIGTLADATNLIALSLGSNPKFECDTLQVSKELLEASRCGKP